MAFYPAGFFGGTFVPPGLAFTQTVVGTAYNTSVTATKVNGTLVNPKVYPATYRTAGTFDGGTTATNNNLNKLGRTLKLRASGIIANTGTPNLTMEFRLGTNILSTTGIVATAAITNTVAWAMESTSVVTTAGSSGVMRSAGCFWYYTTAPVVVSWQMTNSVVGTGLSIDLTATQAAAVYATWGTSSSSNTLTCHEFSGEIIY